MNGSLGINVKSKLSIGVPAYNQGEYLEQTIQSLLNQTVHPVEIVVSNNFSTDSTSKVLEKYSERVRVVTPPSHLSMMKHWNFVVSQLKGEWVSLISSDDVAKPDFVETLLQGIQKSRNAILIRGGWENIDQNGIVRNKHYLLSVRKIASPPETLMEQLLGPKLSFAAFAVKREIWEKVGGFPEECALNGDWGFWLKISPYGNFVYEDRLISQYRANYRDGQEKLRLLQELRDELLIYTDIIPKAASTISNIKPERISRAARSRFMMRISQASQWLNATEKKEALAIFERWDQLAHCSDALERFKCGEEIAFEGSKVILLKQLARRVYTWLR